MKYILFLAIALVCGTDVITAGDSTQALPVVRSIIPLTEAPSGVKPSTDSIARGVPRYGGLYVGPQIGLLGTLGTRIRYVGRVNERPLFFIDAEADVGFLSELRCGAGLVIPGTPYTVACKRGAALYETFLYSGSGRPNGPFYRQYLSLIGLELGTVDPFSVSGSWLLTFTAGANYVIDSAGWSKSNPAPRFMIMNIRMSFLGRLF